MTGDYRFTGDNAYLFDGIDLAVLAIGLFAIPSVLFLLVGGEAVAKGMSTMKGGVLKGAREVIRHKRVVVGNSLPGTGLGIILPVLRTDPAEFVSPRRSDPRVRRPHAGQRSRKSPSQVRTARRQSIDTPPATPVRRSRDSVRGCSVMTHDGRSSPLDPSTRT